MSGALQHEDPSDGTDRRRGVGRWTAATFSLLLLLAACGGDDGSADASGPVDEPAATESGDDEPVEETTETAETTTRAEALRVDFETVQTENYQSFRLFELGDELWLVDSDFSALRIDPSVPVSNCDSTMCLSGSMNFGDTFVQYEDRVFSVETKFTPHQFVWIGAGMVDGPYLVQDENVAPGDLRGGFNERIALVGDRIAAYDESDWTIEHFEAASAGGAGVEPVIGTPIDVDGEAFSGNPGLVSDGETLWLYDASNHLIAPVDLDAGQVGEVVETTGEYGNMSLPVVAGGWLVVDASEADEETGELVGRKLTAYSADGDVVELPAPDGPIRNLYPSGDKAIVVLGEEDDYTTYVVDPATGEAGDPIDLGLEGDYSVTVYHSDDDGAWLVATARDLPTFVIRVDLEAGEVVERIELTQELKDAVGPRFVNGDPYFLIGDGLDERWQLVILGEPGSYGEAVQPVESDDEDATDEESDEDTDRDDDSGSGDSDETTDRDDPGSEDSDDPADESDVPTGTEDAECMGESLMECFG